jgi:hypothetical protein
MISFSSTKYSLFNIVCIISPYFRNLRKNPERKEREEGGREKEKRGKEGRKERRKFGKEGRKRGRKGRREEEK